MAVLPIVTGQDNPILRQKTEPVPKVSKEILKLIHDMEDTVREAQGAGLAAPQVGLPHRLCLALIGKSFVPLINPNITWRSKETNIIEEGCLSLPNVPWRHIERPEEIVVEYLDAKGRAKEKKLKGYDARVVQHEVDHLDGVLIVDYEDVPPATKS